MAASISSYFIPFPVVTGTFPTTSSFDVSTTYIGIGHDAVDGFTTGSEQMAAFVQFYADRVVALVTYVEDSGSGANMPASNPDRLSATFTYPVTGWTGITNSPAGIEIRWGHINNYKKEFFWKRIYRLNKLQRRDLDVPQMLRKSVAGTKIFVNEGIHSTQTTIKFLSFTPDNSLTVNTTTDYTIRMFSTYLPLLSLTQMQNIVQSYILYKSGGSVDVANLSWITFTGGSGIVDIKLSTGDDSAKGIIAMQINDYLSQGAYSIFDRLAFELDDTAYTFATAGGGVTIAAVTITTAVGPPTQGPTIGTQI